MTALSNYDFAMDSTLIATHPLSPKSAAKLLVYDRTRDKITHTTFAKLWDFIPKDCLIVLNDTKVLPARIFGRKLSGGRIEFLYHKYLGEGRVLGQIKGRVKVGEEINIGENIFLRVSEVREDGLRVVKFMESQNLQNPHDLGRNPLQNPQSFSHDSRNPQNPQSFSHDSRNPQNPAQNPQNPRILCENEVVDFLQKEGAMPLPPYIKRQSTKNDTKDYQSVFAKNIGSIAAPTASLHFGDDDLDKLRKHAHCFITLHIGAGTFFGVEAEDIRAHKMHSESFFVSAESMSAIMNAKKILCVGTTATRCVEFLAQNLTQNPQNPQSLAQNLTQNPQNPQGFSGECDIFINPLNPPIKTSHLLTNFHLPKSTLIMLVAGFIGVEKMREIYQIAQNLKYRFYSYGDGMLIL